MTIAETARLIAILKMAWPAHPLEAEQGAAVYHREIAWQEAQRVVGGYRPGDPAPLWSSRVLEDAVNAVGWSAVKACEADQLGTLRAQFRDTYNALLKRVTADDARDALAEADGRRALISFVPRPAPALPSGPVPVPDVPPVPERYESLAGKRARERFERRQAARGPTPTPAVPGWKGLGATARQFVRTRPEPGATPPAQEVPGA
jgi:hypothetical protein